MYANSITIQDFHSWHRLHHIGLILRQTTLLKWQQVAWLICTTQRGLKQLLFKRVVFLKSIISYKRVTCSLSLWWSTCTEFIFIKFTIMFLLQYSYIAFDPPSRLIKQALHCTTSFWNTVKIKKITLPTTMYANFSQLMTTTVWQMDSLFKTYIYVRNLATGCSANIVTTLREKTHFYKITLYFL